MLHLHERRTRWQQLSDRQLLELVVELLIKLSKEEHQVANTVATLLQEVADNNTGQTQLLADLHTLLSSQPAGTLTQDQLDTAISTLETMKQNSAAADASIQAALAVAQTPVAPATPAAPAPDAGASGSVVGSIPSAGSTPAPTTIPVIGTDGTVTRVPAPPSTDAAAGTSAPAPDASAGSTPVAQ